MIFLDNDVIIEILNSSSERGSLALKILEEQGHSALVISSIVYEEILFGVYKKFQIDELQANHPLLRFPVIEFSKEDAELAAKIEYQLEKLGKKKPRGDILIASTVINKNSKLFTFNTKHFENIPNLNLLSH
jgi:tRNA(fMet)-specific endonuclease VapC